LGASRLLISFDRKVCAVAALLRSLRLLGEGCEMSKVSVKGVLIGAIVDVVASGIAGIPLVLYVVRIEFSWHTKNRIGQ
jgi:hypothetical protein